LTTNKGGRPKGPEIIAAQKLGLTKKQVQRIGLDRLELMRPEALALIVSIAKSSRRIA
jgi:hypothetical protein